MFDYKTEYRCPKIITTWWDTSIIVSGYCTRRTVLLVIKHHKLITGIVLQEEAGIKRRGCSKRWVSGNMWPSYENPDYLQNFRAPEHTIHRNISWNTGLWVMYGSVSSLHNGYIRLVPVKTTFHRCGTSVPYICSMDGYNMLRKCQRYLNFDNAQQSRFHSIHM